MLKYKVVCAGGIDKVLFHRGEEILTTIYLLDLKFHSIWIDWIILDNRFRLGIK